MFARPRRLDSSGPFQGSSTAVLYAIYHSLLAFIRTLLEISADPNEPVDDGFPPLIAAMSCARDARGTRVGRMSTTSFGCCCRLARTRISAASMTTHRCTWPSPSVIRLAAQILLDGGADPELPTRIDECRTPLEMAEAPGLTVNAAMLARKGKPLRQRMRSGLTLLVDMPGTGELVRRAASSIST